MKSNEKIIQELIDKGLIDTTERTEEQQKEFADIKFKIAQIQFNKLEMSEDKKYIEANPATHAIATWVYSELTTLRELSAKQGEEIKRLSKVCNSSLSTSEDAIEKISQLQKENDKLMKLLETKVKELAFVDAENCKGESDEITGWINESWEQFKQSNSI